MSDGPAATVLPVARELRPWETIGSETAFDHRWHHLRRETVRLPSGRIVDDYFVTDRPDVVLVFALTADRQVVFVRQWKQGRRAFLVELPGGMCDPGEAPSDAAARELLEETGYACDALEPLGQFEQDPTKDTNTIIAFLGRAARPVGAPNLDDQEELEVLLTPLEDLKPAVRDGRITSAGTLATIFRALDELEPEAS